MRFLIDAKQIRTVSMLMISSLLLFSVGCDDDLTGPLNSNDRSAVTAEAGSGNYYAGNLVSDDYYPGTEQHGVLSYNDFVNTEDDNLSTFGVDVDAGSYTFGRKKINEGIIPSPSSVRVEEYINYFRQEYPQPTEGPFSVSLDGAPSPFRGDSLHLLRIGLQGQAPSETGAPWNITFLIDVSGSMGSRMNLVKNSLYILVDNMRQSDKISICTYASATETILNPTGLEEIDAQSVKDIIAELTAGGSTAMGSGLQNAYDVNNLGHMENGVNRVIVCSDGDANVGGTSHEAILELIDEYVDQGITLSTLGYGSGNYNDLMMEQLADQGNGNYYYIDSEEEARRLFTEEISGLMEVIAKDVKIQVEFNPASVKRYRLIGYENRDIADEEFENDSTDTGDIGAGHRVTALYELEINLESSSEFGTVHLRYKLPQGETDIPMDVEIRHMYFADDIADASDRFKFTAAVAEYAEILRESPHVTSTLAEVETIMAASLNGSDDRDAEVLELLRALQTID